MLKLSIKDWRRAKVMRVAKVADDMLSIEVKPEGWIPHKAGQHYELRLPGYHLSRKYSVVSSPHHEGSLEFGIQLLPYGEVSPKLWQLKPGDVLEVRGPLGAFTWMPGIRGPLILVAGGSGITPLLAMYDHYMHINPAGQAVLIVSAKHEGKIFNYDKHKSKLVVRFTAQDGRIDQDFLESTVAKFAANPAARCLTCGPVVLRAVL